MNTVRGSIEKRIHRSPYLRDALASGIVNVSSLARKIHPDIEADLRKEVTVDAVFMALKRLAAALPPASMDQPAPGAVVGDITLRTGLVQLTVANSDRLQLTLAQGLNQARPASADFYAMTNALHESTVTASHRFAAVIESWLQNERVTSRRDNLTALALYRRSTERRDAVGSLEQPLQLLSWNGIVAVDVISTTHELIVVLDDADVATAIDVLRTSSSSGEVAS